MQIKNKQTTVQACFVLCLAVTFYFYEALLQVSPSVMVPELMRSFNVNAGALGNLAAFYFYAYTCMQLPVGALIDKYGPRRLLTSAATLCAIGCFIFGSTEHLHYAEFGRLLIGLGASFAAIGCFQLAGHWFPPHRFAMLVGLIVGLSLVGSANGETTVAVLVEQIGWRDSMLTFSVVGGVIALFIALFVRDYPNDAKPTQQPVNLWKGLPGIIKNRQSWFIAIYGCFMFTPTLVFAGLWGVPFLMHSYPLTRTYAATLIALIFIGYAIGGPIMGWFSDYIQRRKIPMMLGSTFALFCLSTVIYIHLPPFFLGLLLFLFGFTSSGFLPAFANIREINSPMYSATSLGFMNTLNSVGGALLQPLVGVILDYYWGGKMAKGIRVYSEQDFHIALLILPTIIALALLILPFIKETHCKPQYTPAT